MSKLNIKHTVSERFLQYVKIDTQSNPESNTCPSTEKQKKLSKILVQELKDMGIKDAMMDDYGYVYATLESNTDKKVPVVCLCAHVDTSPDASGKDVKPVIHKNYQGGEIKLPGDSGKIIKPVDHPDLKDQIGKDIITSDGTTLLGADDKAGIAEIMETVKYFTMNPGIRHGKVKILFTPDEEIGRGVDKVDLKKLGADIGYTVDGETVGYIENETFSADGVTLRIQGFNIHPGFAKDRMENAIKITAGILEKLPKNNLSPETTENRDGFIHPISISGNVDAVVLKFIIRDFETEGLKVKEDFLKKITEEVISKYNRSSFDFKVDEQYRNMKIILEKNPQIVEYAMEAVKRTGIVPKLGSIRGGTDGSRLSFMGLPTPNIFAGGHAFHSNLEWISIQDMEKAVETLIHLIIIWEEKLK